MSVTSTLPYEEEEFGILTDDNLYLDCILVRPTHMPDEALKGIRVWVPKHPLTKNTLLTCARQEVRAHGQKHKIAHLVFDLRGTGDSDGVLGDHQFELDLKATKAWARERFGRINFGFLGTPTLKNGRVNLWPLRIGSVMESYYYPPSSSELAPPSILYLATYGNFSQTDDVICSRLAKEGYSVYGVDPLRYLLHASAKRTLKPEDLWEDADLLTQMLVSNAVIIAHPLSAGLGLIWASRISRINGIIAMGRAQAGLSPKHIFQNNNPYTFMLHRYTPNIAPRPLCLVKLNGHPLGGDDKELNSLFDSSQEPHRLERIDQLSIKFFLSQLDWIRESAANA